MDSWTIAKEVDPIGKNSRGDPLCAINTGAGWLKLSGDLDLLQQLFPGAKVRHGPVKMYGKQKFATLYEVERDSYQRQKELSPPAPKPATQPPAPRPEPQIMGGLPQAPGVPTWKEYQGMLRAAHRLAYDHEPDIPCDPKTNDQFINNATARAAIVNTIMIAFTNGKVQAPKETEPEIPGADAPMPDDEGFPWERAS